MNAPDGSMSIDINNNLVHTIEQNIDALPGVAREVEKFTIFRVPKHIRKKKKVLYKPRMVSIGPYYNGKDALQAMERHKWRYLRDLLSRNTRNHNLEHYISELRKLESEARRCYFEEVKTDESDQFLMMMLLDGCFIIEYLIKYYSGFQDVIFDVSWACPVIRSDLLLFENQIPFFVIQKLFGLLNCSNHFPSGFTSNPEIEPLVNILLEYLSKGKQTTCPGLELVEIKHILHLYHLCYVSSPRSDNLSVGTDSVLGWLNPIKPIFKFLMCFRKLCFRRTESSEDEKFRETIPCATELMQAGVIFKRSKSNNILDIKFQHGTLEIPFLSIDETQRSLLLSLVSFEQHNNNLEMNLTSYANFMSRLFQTAKDVTLLEEKKVIQNLLATNEELVSFFNGINDCAYLDYDKQYLKKLLDNVNKYYEDDWHKWNATLKRDYFSNPWSTLSFIAAFVLLALTVLQSVYTILTYY